MKVNGRIQLYPMLRVAGFLVAGIVLGTWLRGDVPDGMWYVALLASIAVAFILMGRAVAQTVALFAACVCLGGSLVVHELSSVDVALPRGDTEFRAVVASQPEVAGKVVRCDIIVTDAPQPMKVRAAFYRDARAGVLRPGVGIKAKAQLEKPSSYAGSTFDYGRYLLFHGYSATAFMYVDDWQGCRVSLERLSVVERTKIVALRIRERLLDVFRRSGVDGQVYAVLAAMALGERVSMSEDMTDDYSVSGALHVLSLSGLHLGIIYAMLMILFFRRRNSVVVQSAIVLAVWAYVFIAGLPVSAVRSAVMLSVYSFVSLLNRDKISLNVLAVAAFSVLVANPLNFYDVGFQMSFVSVLFIILFYPVFYNMVPVKARHIPILGYVWQMTAVSLSAQLGVAPLVAFYFGRFSCYFLLANFVVIPVSTIILYGAVLVLLTDCLPWLQGALCFVVVKAIELMNASVSFVAAIPGASIDGIEMNIVQLLMVYVIVFAVYLLLPYIRKLLWVYR